MTNNNNQLGKEKAAKKRLEQLRKALRAENISYGELAELESLKEYIDIDDVELRQAAGIPEFEEEEYEGDEYAKGGEVYGDFTIKIEKEKSAYNPNYKALLVKVNKDGVPLKYVLQALVDYKDREYLQEAFNNKNVQVLGKMGGSSRYIPLGFVSKDLYNKYVQTIGAGVAQESGKMIMANGGEVANEIENLSVYPISKGRYTLSGSPIGMTGYEFANHLQHSDFSLLGIELDAEHSKFFAHGSKSAIDALHQFLRFKRVHFRKSPKRTMADGGMMADGGHVQGYDDREDERLSMEHGKMADKDFVGSHSRREHSRRDDAEFEERYADGGTIEGYKDLSSVNPSKIEIVETTAYGKPDKLILKHDGKKIAQFYYNTRGFNQDFVLKNAEGKGFQFGGDKPKSIQVSNFKKALKEGFTHVKFYDEYAKGGETKPLDIKVGDWFYDTQKQLNIEVTTLYPNNKVILKSIDYNKNGEKKTFSMPLHILKSKVKGGSYFKIPKSNMKKEDGGMMAKGGKTKKLADNSSLVRFAQTDEQLQVLQDIIPIFDEKGIQLSFGTSVGKSPQAIIFDKDYQDGILYIGHDGWDGQCTYDGEDFSNESALEYIIENPEEYANGGMMAKGGKVGMYQLMPYVSMGQMRNGSMSNLSSPSFKETITFEGTQDEAIKKANDMVDNSDIITSVEVSIINPKATNVLKMTKKIEMVRGTKMANGGMFEAPIAKMKEVSPNSELKEFKDYVKSFYGKGETYADFFPPNGASDKEISVAIKVYYDWAKTKKDQWGGGDSFDREIVRDVILHYRGIEDLEHQKAVKEILKHQIHLIMMKEDGGMMADGGMMSEGGTIDNNYKNNKLPNHIKELSLGKNINGFELANMDWKGILWMNKNMPDVKFYASPFYAKDDAVFYQLFEINKYLPYKEGSESFYQVLEKNIKYKLSGDLDKDAKTYFDIVETITKNIKSEIVDMDEEILDSDGQTDEELYDALFDMGYRFGKFGTAKFKEDAFAETAIDLGYSYDEDKKLWFNTNMMAKGGKLGSKAKYIPKYQIEEVEVDINGKEKEIDGADLLDGLYVKKAAYDRKSTPKKAKGGQVKAKSNRGGNVKEIAALAKSIRKDGEKWTDAIKRAAAQLKK